LKCVVSDASCRRSEAKAALDLGQMYKGRYRLPVYQHCACDDDYRAKKERHWTRTTGRICVAAIDVMLLRHRMDFLC
jgi:hypothetical protein